MSQGDGGEGMGSGVGAGAGETPVSSWHCVVTGIRKGAVMRIKCVKCDRSVFQLNMNSELFQCTNPDCKRCGVVVTVVGTSRGKKAAARAQDPEPEQAAGAGA